TGTFPVSLSQLRAPWTPHPSPHRIGIQIQLCNLHQPCPSPRPTRSSDLPSRTRCCLDAARNRKDRKDRKSRSGLWCSNCARWTSDCGCPSRRSSRPSGRPCCRAIYETTEARPRRGVEWSLLVR
ncbi:hypothetical protein E4U43_008073, partial [Claviceps pusilla]